MERIQRLPKAKQRFVMEMIDTDLATLYGVTTSALVQAVKRNIGRFPEDFMFQLTAAEWAVLRSRIVIPTSSRGGTLATSI
jgi:hypothetical protein